MILGYITLLVLTACVFYLEARTDADGIAHGKPVDHGKELTERAIFCLVVLLFSVGLSFAAHHFDPVLAIKRTFVMAFVCWGWFTLGFRYGLNRMRGKHWAYISTSNNYDRVFYALSMAWFVFKTIVMNKSASSKGDEEKHFNRGGKLAYTFEASVFTAFTILYFNL